MTDPVTALQQLGSAIDGPALLWLLAATTVVALLTLRRLTRSRLSVKRTSRPGMIQELTIYKADIDTGLPVDGDFQTCQTCHRYTFDATTSEWVPVEGPEWSAPDQYACATSTTPTGWGSTCPSATR